MSCDLPYYAAIDWQVAAIDVLSTPALEQCIFSELSSFIRLHTGSQTQLKPLMTIERERKQLECAGVVKLTLLPG